MLYVILYVNFLFYEQSILQRIVKVSITHNLKKKHATLMYLMKQKCLSAPEVFNIPTYIYISFQTPHILVTIVDRDPVELHQSVCIFFIISSVIYILINIRNTCVDLIWQKEGNEFLIC